MHGGIVGIPPYVDRRLGYRIGDFPRENHELIGGRLVVCRAAMVRWNGQEYPMCLGFDAARINRNPSEEPPVMAVGLLGVDSGLYTITADDASRMTLLGRTLPATGTRRMAGVSIEILLQYLRQAEEWLVVWQGDDDAAGTPDESTYAMLRRRVADERIPEAMMLPYCAALFTTEVFYNARVYGGAVNMPELYLCADYIVRGMGEIAGTAHDMRRRLHELDRISVWNWNDEQLAAQRHVVTYILALLRRIEADG